MPMTAPGGTARRCCSAAAYMQAAADRAQNYVFSGSGEIRESKCYYSRDAFANLVGTYSAHFLQRRPTSLNSFTACARFCGLLADAT